MTAHVHSPSAQGENRVPGPSVTGGVAKTSARPRWLLPGLAIGTIAAALVIAGVLSFSTVLYAGLIGGMLLMHAGGHGSHGGHGGGHQGQGSGTASDAATLRQPSSGAQPLGSDSDGGLEDRAPIDRSGSETHDDDRHSSYGCH